MSRKVRLRVKELAQQKGLSEWDLVARSGLDVQDKCCHLSSDKVERETFLLWFDGMPIIAFSLRFSRCNSTINVPDLLQ
jgi:hypothetical protein